VTSPPDSSPRRPPGRPARYSLDELLDVVVREFISRGYDAASMEDLARATGLTKSSIYHHVTGKEQLLRLADQLPYVTLLLRVRGNTEAERWALSRRRDFDTRLSALVQHAIDEGDLRADLDPRVVTRLLFGMVNSLTEWFRPGGQHHVKQVADTLVALALDGLRARR
jgi:AcrR family transcriptional regulator